MRRAPRRSARSFFVLPLVLALLALAVVPVFAHAGIPTYETEETPNFTVPTKKPKPKHQTTGHEEKNNAPAEGSDIPKEPEEKTGGEKNSENSENTTGGAPKNEGGGGGGGGGNESSKPNKGGQTGNGNGGGSENKIGEKQDLGGESPATLTASKSSSDGGSSSPIVPILIVVVVLAALSIGVVLYRQRKSSGSGPDSRVSSPNAS